MAICATTGVMRHPCVQALPSWAEMGTVAALREFLTREEEKGRQGVPRRGRAAVPLAMTKDFVAAQEVKLSHSPLSLLTKIPPLQVFKARLDWVLSSLVQWKVP